MSEFVSIPQLTKMLNDAGKSIDEAIAPVVKSTINKAADTQRANVPVRTGHTKKSIKATGVNGAPFTSKTIDAEAGPTFFVGRLIELGTSHSAPHVFVGNSLDPHIAQHVKEVQSAAIKAMGW